MLLRLNFEKSYTVKKKDYQMKQKHIMSIMTGFLVLSAALITGLANANLATERKNKSMIHAQKLDTNNDGSISLDELTAPHDRRFAGLDRDENGMIEKHEFNNRLVSMFHRMDQNGDGILRGDELPGNRFGVKKHEYIDTASGPSINR